MIDLRLHTKGRATRVRSSLCRVLERRARRIVQRLTLQHREVRVTLDLVDDDIMTDLHGRHMGEFKTTDVLAFPDPDGVPGSGDIALNWDAVMRQAESTEHRALLDEATSLCIHAVAHLLGHDHRDHSQARRMLRVERRPARNWRLVLDRPYARELDGG